MDLTQAAKPRNCGFMQLVIVPLLSEGLKPLLLLTIPHQLHRRWYWKRQSLATEIVFMQLEIGSSVAWALGFRSGYFRYSTLKSYFGEACCHYNLLKPCLTETLPLKQRMTHSMSRSLLKAIFYSILYGYTVRTDTIILILFTLFY